MALRLLVCGVARRVSSAQQAPRAPKARKEFKVQRVSRAPQVRRVHKVMLAQRVQLVRTVILSLMVLPLRHRVRVTMATFTLTRPRTRSPDRRSLACGVARRVSSGRPVRQAQPALRVRKVIVSLPQATSDLACGALGVDVNPDHLAVCRVDKHGNPLLWKKLPIKTTGSSGERLASIHAAVNAACRLALASAVKDGVDVPVVTERLNFGYAKTNLRYLPAKLANKLSSFAYSAILQLITVRSANLGLQNFTVSPAYTSKLGQANYAAPYGVSTDLGAACCIARRAKGLKERLRPLVLSRAPEDARVATSSRSVNRAVASVRLPSRSQTYSCSWLSRSRGSATPSEVDGERLLGTSGLQQSQLVFPARAGGSATGRSLSMYSFVQV